MRSAKTCSEVSAPVRLICNDTNNSAVMRAIRALNSPAYQKARAKNPLLPEVHDRASAENTFKLLPLSLLALRVSKVDPEVAHEGHNHAKPKRVKGLWTVKIEQHQEANDDNYYIWLYEGSQWKQKLYAAGALVLVIAVVLFPLWPLFLRQGVWYLSMGMLGLIGLFFAMAIVRLILFIITMFAAPPGLWLYPNLFEDVGFFDSFRPVWAWQEVSPLHFTYQHSPPPPQNNTNNPSRHPKTSKPAKPQKRNAKPPNSPQKQTAPPPPRRAKKALALSKNKTNTNTNTSTATSRKSPTTRPSSKPSLRMPRQSQQVQRHRRRLRET